VSPAPGSVAGVNDSRSSSPAAPSYPGERLGLPERGAGSVAGWGRRLLALMVDWLASTLVAAGLFGYQWFGATAGEQGWVGATPILVFLVEATLLTALMGGSFGQLLVRIGVARVDGSAVTVPQAFVRTLLICLVIPPLVFNRDQRGLHDLAAGTVALRR
jgi:uncharacterized RDD family membrane protein YckC